MAGRAAPIVVVLAALASWSCGGKDVTTPTGTSTGTPPGTGGATTGPLPLGQASGSDVSCPSGSPAGSTCTRLAVACPSVPASSAVVRLTRPIPAIASRGTVVLTSGGDGTIFSLSLSPLVSGMIASYTANGLVVADLAWEAPGIWGGPQARTLACRAATALRWIYDNVHTGGRSRLFAAQGTSNGASQIAFALAHYGVDYLDVANLGSGPLKCPPGVFCAAQGQQGPEPLLPSDPPAVNRQPQLAYSSTTVRFFLGDQEPTPQIASDARAFFDAIITAKSLAVVPGTGHHIEDTQAGIDAFRSSILAALR